MRKPLFPGIEPQPPGITTRSHRAFIAFLPGCFWVILSMLNAMTIGSHAECAFPEYLQPSAEGATLWQGPTAAPHADQERHWVTQTKYLHSSRGWESQLEITVRRDQVIAKIKFEAQCLESGGGNVPCYHREVVYRKTCIKQDGVDKYIVKSLDHGETEYHCMKFVKRNKNLIQIWTGRSVHDIDQGEHLCLDSALQREEWPWIAPVQEEWHLCPIIGGFDFWAHISQPKERVCPEQWRPSRFETECIMGEGMEFEFPDTSCSPLQNQSLDLRVQCWASWEEEGFLFIVAGEGKLMPQFVLRFPTNWLSQGEPFTVHWYFSPIAPTTRRGTPTGRINIQILEMETRQSEPGICFDESPLCIQYAREGRCTNSALYKYANYCKRSCGLCDSLPSPRPECRFPSSYRGDWVLFEDDRSEQVTVSSGHITFSSLGEFTCKSRHWANNHYKLLSRYSNGCRPRYTCMNFEQNADDALQFQLSKSERSDQSFKLCQFQDDPLPLGGRIRSAQLKTLLPSSKTKGDTCGLNGLVRVSTVPDARGHFCQGTLSDWNQHACGSESRLQLRLRGSCTGSRVGRLDKEYVCVAYVGVETGYSLLITKSDVGATYQKYTCWVIKTYAERMYYKPWREAYILEKANCGTEGDFDPNSLLAASMALQTESDTVHRPCGQDSGTRLPSKLHQPVSDEAEDNDDSSHKEREVGHLQDVVYNVKDASYHGSGTDRVSQTLLNTATTLVIMEVIKAYLV